ncbi:MAG: hypothetical protein K2P87_08110 [Lachnospiraceae bacterium]|nr:hypothetical protein [Lachnospiraceae bacterium]
MKKRILSLMLCLVLVCAGFAGCGSKDDGVSGIAPERLVKVKLEEFADRVTDALSQADKNTISTENVGYDMTAEVKIGEQIASSYNMQGLSSLGLKLSMDVKEAAQMRMEGTMLLNEQDVITAEAVVTQERVFFNFPAYSEKFAGISFEDILGKSLEDYAAELAAVNEGMPAAKDMLDMWKSFSAKFVDAFEYQGKEEKQTIGIGDYKVTGDKYITTAKMEEVNDAIRLLVEELKKFPKLQVQEFIAAEDGLDSFSANYYVGKKGQYAWEFQAVKDDETIALVYISTEKGFYLYGVDPDGKDTPIASSKKESAQKGKITIFADENFVIEYDNYTKNSVDLSMTLDGMVLKLKVLSANDHLALDFDINATGVIVAGKLESKKGDFDLTASISISGMELGSLKLNAKKREFASYEVPSSYVDQEEWSTGLDQEKLMGDLSQLMIQFPFLMDMMQ